MAIFDISDIKEVWVAGGCQKTLDHRIILGPLAATHPIQWIQFINRQMFLHFTRETETSLKGRLTPDFGVIILRFIWDPSKQKPSTYFKIPWQSKLSKVFLVSCTFS